MKNLKGFELFTENSNMVKQKTIWVGKIVGIFGYGMCVLGNSEKECMKALRENYDEWKKARKETTNQEIFLEAFEYWGGRVEEVKIG